MESQINNYLEQLQQEKNIKILLACETGSRAWGFPSPDSDYDVRIIYQHEKDWYLSLSEKKGHIDKMYDSGEIDITGWDLRKCLNLLMKSNAALLERVQSHIIYKSDEAFVKNINELAQTAYSPIATAYHYLSMGKKLFADVKDKQEYKLKRFFYVLRSTMACIWIKEQKKMPPIDFHIMLKELKVPAEILERIYELIELKSSKSEAYLHSGENHMIDFIDHHLTLTGKTFKSLPHSRINIEQFDQFFINQLNQDLCISRESYKKV